MKAVLISIQPKWCELIASGKKTIEVRKTRPKIDTRFKCYIYCTQGKYNPQNCGENSLRDCFVMEGKGVVNGKVIGEFVCNWIDEYSVAPPNHHGEHIYLDILPNVRSAMCMQPYQLGEYGKGKTLYGWHISDLKIYDKPKELGEFEKPHPEECPVKQSPTFGNTNPCWICGGCTIRRPPQSWCYVEAQ